MRGEIAAILILASTLCAAQNTTQVKNLKGEKWWGVYVDNAPVEPFGPTAKVNTRGANRVPLLLSSSGRYVFSQSSMKADFDAAGFTLSTDQPVEVIQGGRNLREAYLVACHKNFAPTTAMPSADLFSKVIYYTSAELRANDNQQSLIAYVDRLIAEGFPRGVVVVSDGWSTQPGEFSFNPDYYPLPKQMVDEIHSRGFKVMLCVSPYAPSWGRNFIEYKIKSALVTAADGSVVVARDDDGYFTLFDMRSQSIVDNMSRSLEKLQRESGVDGFAFDYRAASQVLKGRDLEMFERGMTSLASSFDMAIVNASPSKRYTPYAATMEYSSGKPFECLSSALNSALSASLLGFSSFGMEAPAEAVDMTDEQMLRTVQLSLFMPVAIVPFAPWRIGDNKLYSEVRRNVNLRAKIGADVADAAKENAKTGEPLMRVMEYQFPREGFADCSDQYLFAGKYLVAPMVGGAAATRLIRIPKGVWQSTDGKNIRGPRVLPADPADGKLQVFELTGR